MLYIGSEVSIITIKYVERFLIQELKIFQNAKYSIKNAISGLVWWLLINDAM